METTVMRRIATLLVLAACTAFAGQVSNEDAQKSVAQMSNVKQLLLASIMFSADHDDHLPNFKNMKGLPKELAPYVRRSNLFKPLFSSIGELKGNGNIAKLQQVDVDEPAKTPMLYFSKPDPTGKYCVGYVDGHVQRLDADGWKKLQPMLHWKPKRVGL